MNRIKDLRITKVANLLDGTTMNKTLRNCKQGMRRWLGQPEPVPTIPPDVKMHVGWAGCKKFCRFVGVLENLPKESVQVLWTVYRKGGTGAHLGRVLRRKVELSSKAVVQF